MKLFGGLISISGVSFFIFCVFSIMVLGYLLGKLCCEAEVDEE